MATGGSDAYEIVLAIKKYVFVVIPRAREHSILKEPKGTYICAVLFAEHQWQIFPL